MPRVGVDQHHQIIRISRVLNIGVLSPSRGGNRLFQHTVYLSEIDVAEYWRDHPALGNSFCPGRLQDHLQELHHRCILNPPCHLLQEQRMLNIVKVGAEIQIDDSCLSLDNGLGDAVHRLMG